MATGTGSSAGGSTQLLPFSLPLTTAGQGPRGTGLSGSHNSLAMTPHPLRVTDSMPQQRPPTPVLHEAAPRT